MTDILVLIVLMVAWAATLVIEMSARREAESELIRSETQRLWLQDQLAIARIEVTRLSYRS